MSLISKGDIRQGYNGYILSGNNMGQPKSRRGLAQWGQLFSSLGKKREEAAVPCN